MSAAPSRRRRSAVLLIWLALVLAGIAVISRTQFSADLSAFLPASPDARQRVLIEQLQSGVASRTLMIGLEDGRDAAQRAPRYDRLRERAASNSHRLQAAR